MTAQRLVEFAILDIPGTEHASITVVADGRSPRTSAGTDTLPYEWDELQYRCGEGPCLTAIAANGVESAPDLSTDGRWPRFARAAVDQTPVRSMLSLRLSLAEPERTGLNLYATRPGAFTDQSVATATIFSAYASLALLAAARQHQASHLARAVETNREIGVAMGILMAGSKLTSQQAFDRLRTTSQHLNRRLRDVAAEVALSGVLPEGAPQQVRRSRHPGTRTRSTARPGSTSGSERR